MNNIWKTILESGDIDPFSGTTSTTIKESDIRKAWEQIYKDERFNIDYSLGYMSRYRAKDEPDELTELKTEIKSLQV